jgi:NAD(P)-dependent dehydrogenase (short-subunit alcohol dehydrogenase family)
MSAAGAAGSEARTALVTGASSGIGAAIAKAFGALGWRVAIGARRKDRLVEVARDLEQAGGRAFAHALDVTQPASIDAFFDAAREALGPADVVVSNAGVGVPNLLHEARVEDLRKELDTNLFGPMLLARRAIPALVELGRGDLVFISSLNAVAPRTFQAAYTASKAGLEGLAKVIQMELEGTGVRSTIVRPGPTGSEFGASYGGEMARRLLESWKYWGIMRQLHWMYPEHVARAVVAVVTAPRGTHFDVIEVLPENPKRGPL